MALMQSQGVQLSLLHQPSKQWYSHRTHGTQKLLAEKSLPQIARIYTLSLQKNTTQSHKLQNDQGKTMIAKDSFVPLL